VTREGWAAALGYGRTTVQRWESGETVPDAAAEAAIIAHCQAHGLFRRLERGPLAGLVLTPESLATLLAAARVSGRRRQPAVPGQLVEVAAPPRTDGAPPSNLTLALTSFVGRERDRAGTNRTM
jgi:hypothetical protein